MSDPIRELVRDLLNERITDDMIERAIAREIVDRIASVSARTGAALLDMPKPAFRREFVAAKLDQTSPRYSVAAIEKKLLSRTARTHRGKAISQQQMEAA